MILMLLCIQSYVGFCLEGYIVVNEVDVKISCVRTCLILWVMIVDILV